MTGAAALAIDNTQLAAPTKAVLRVALWTQTAEVYYRYANVFDTPDNK